MWTRSWLLTWPHMDLVLTQNLTMFGLRPHSDLSKYGLSLVPKLDHIWTQSWLVLKEAQTLNHLGGDSVVLMTAFLCRVHVVLFLDFSSCKLSCDPSGWMSSSKTSRLGTTGLLVYTRCYPEKLNFLPWMDQRNTEPEHIQSVLMFVFHTTNTH